MSGEIRLPATTALTVKALILDEAGLVWNGSALVAVSTLTDANWTASLIACTEQDTSEAAGTGLYLADWPAGLTQTAVYAVVFYSGASPLPGDLHIGSQQNPTEHAAGGNVTVGAMTQAALVQFATDDTGETASVDGSVTKLSQGSGGGNIGSGSVTVTITTNDTSNNPLDGVKVWISTDSAGTNVVAGVIVSDAAGLTTFLLDAASYYVWRQLAGYNFTNPQAITVS